MNDDEYQLTCNGEPKTIEWCEENCQRYYSCDSIAEALEAEKEKEDEQCDFCPRKIRTEPCTEFEPISCMVENK